MLVSRQLQNQTKSYSSTDHATISQVQNLVELDAIWFCTFIEKTLSHDDGHYPPEDHDGQEDDDNCTGPLCLVRIDVSESANTYI